MFSIELKGFDDLQDNINAIIEVIKHPKNVFEFAKNAMYQDVIKHFDNTESPQGQWQWFSPTTISMKINQGKWPAKLLQDTGKLRAIVKEHTDNYAAVGTNLQTQKYGRMQNYGGDTKMFGKHEVTIPSREFMWLSDEAKGRILNQFVIALKEAS